MGMGVGVGMYKDTKKPGPLVFQNGWSLNINCINGEIEVKLKKSCGSLGEIMRSVGSGCLGVALGVRSGQGRGTPLW